MQQFDKETRIRENATNIGIGMWSKLVKQGREQYAKFGDPNIRREPSNKARAQLLVEARRQLRFVNDQLEDAKWQIVEGLRRLTEAKTASDKLRWNNYLAETKRWVKKEAIHVPALEERISRLEWAIQVNHYN